MGVRPANWVESPSPPVTPRGRRGDRNLLILLFISKADPLLVAAATSPK